MLKSRNGGGGRAAIPGGAAAYFFLHNTYISFFRLFIFHTQYTQFIRCKIRILNKCFHSSHSRTHLCDPQTFELVVSLISPVLQHLKHMRESRYFHRCLYLFLWSRCSNCGQCSQFGQCRRCGRCSHWVRSSKDRYRCICVQFGVEWVE